MLQQCSFACMNSCYVNKAGLWPYLPLKGYVCCVSCSLDHHSGSKELAALPPSKTLELSPWASYIFLLSSPAVGEHWRGKARGCSPFQDHFCFPVCPCTEPNHLKKSGLARLYSGSAVNSYFLSFNQILTYNRTCSLVPRLLSLLKRHLVKSLLEAQV